MDEQQQQRVNQAAETFADAIKESSRALAERGVSAQEVNAQLTQNFFNQVIDNLQSQAADTRELTQTLAEQQQRGLDAAQQLTQEGVGAYMEFVNSFMSMSQAVPEAARRAEERSR
jgi:ABC-type transporter Mla subunit MlaD